MNNRGMTLEKLINSVNLEYRKAQVGLIVKKSTPLQVTKKGVVAQMSTVDYHGLYKIGEQSIPVAFDAKETKNKSSFPLSNVKDHQILFLDLWSRLGGDAFLLIYFTSLKIAYKVPIKFILDFISYGARKSIPLDDFKSEWKVDLSDYLGLFNNAT